MIASIKQKLFCSQSLGLLTLLAGVSVSSACWADPQAVHTLQVFDASTRKQLSNDASGYFGQKLIIQAQRNVAGATDKQGCKFELLDAAGKKITEVDSDPSCKRPLLVSEPHSFPLRPGQRYTVKSHFTYTFNRFILMNPILVTKTSDQSVSITLPALGGTAEGVVEGRRLTATAALSPPGVELQVLEGSTIIARATTDSNGNATAMAENLTPGSHDLIFRAVAGEDTKNILEKRVVIAAPPTPTIALRWDDPANGSSIDKRSISISGKGIAEYADLAANGMEYWVKAAADSWENNYDDNRACPIDTTDNTFRCQVFLKDAAWDSPYADIQLAMKLAGAPRRAIESRRFLIRRPAEDLLQVSSLQTVAPDNSIYGDATHAPGSKVQYQVLITALNDVGDFEINFPLPKGLRTDGMPTLTWIEDKAPGYVEISDTWPDGGPLLRATHDGSTTNSAYAYMSPLVAGDSFSIQIPLIIDENASGTLRSKMIFKSAHFDQPHIVEASLDVVPARVTLDPHLADGWHGGTFNVVGTVDHPYGSGTDSLGADAVQLWWKTPSGSWPDAPQAHCPLVIDKQHGSFRCALSLRDSLPETTDRLDIRVRIKGRDGYLSAPADASIRMDLAAPKLDNVSSTPLYDAKQTLLIEGNASDEQSGLGMPDKPETAIEIIWGHADTAKKCPDQALDASASSAWSTARRKTCAIANGKFACEAELGTAWSEASAAICVRAWDQAGNVRQTWQLTELASLASDAFDRATVEVENGSLNDVDESGGFTPGDTFSYQLELRASRSIKHLKIDYTLPAGLEPSPDKVPTIRVNGNDASKSMLNASWNGKSSTVVTGNEVDLVANDKLSISLPLRLTAGAPATLDSNWIIGGDSVIGTRKLTHAMDLQQRLPSSRALEISLEAGEDAVAANRPGQTAAARVAPGTSFLLHLRANIKQWDLRGAVLTLRLPAALTADGIPRVAASSPSDATNPSGVASLPTANATWNGADEPSLLAAGATLRRQTAFDVAIPVRVRADAQGGTVTLSTRADADNLDVPIDANAPIVLAATALPADKLRLIAEAVPAHAAPGESIDYRIEYTNASDETLTNLSISEPVPVHASYIEGSARCVAPIPENAHCKVLLLHASSSDNVRWLIDRLGANQGGVLTFSVRLDSNDQASNEGNAR